ncbi:MAG: HAD family hydrolase [Wenzhouxiangella sp.]
MARPEFMPKAVLFDLDGTLVDTAPDLVGTLMALRAARGLDEMEESALRPMATRGALGLLEAGFGHEPGYEAADLREEFLSHYAANIWVRSCVFDGIEHLLKQLQQQGLGLGIVTNKVEALAVPVVEKAGWADLFACLIAGDTISRSKPDPAPVLEACRRLNLAPEEVMFVGDDPRDVEAGRGAGVMTVVASWGYLPAGDDASGWGADVVINHPSEVLTLLRTEDRCST